MAFELISPEIDPYIGGAIVVAIFGFLVYLASHLRRGGEQREPPGTRRPGGGGGGGDGIFKRIWKWLTKDRGEREPSGRVPEIAPSVEEPPAAQEEAKEEVKEEKKVKEGEVKIPEIEAAAQRGVEEEMHEFGEIPDLVPEDILGDEGRRVLERIKPIPAKITPINIQSVRNNILFLLQSAEIFFKTEENKLKTIEPKLMSLIHAIDSLKKSALKEAKIEEIVLKEVEEIKRLLMAEVNSLQKRINRDRINLNVIESGIKKKGFDREYEVEKHGLYSLEEKIRQLMKELRMHLKLLEHLQVKKGYTTSLIKSFLRLDEGSEKLENLGIHLLEFEEKVEPIIDKNILPGIYAYKQQTQNYTFDYRKAREINNFVCESILYILEHLLQMTEELEKINKELFSIVEGGGGIQGNLWLLNQSLHISEKTAKDFEKICDLERNQNQKQIFDRIVKFDHSLAKRVHRSFKKIKEFKDSLHEQKKRIKRSVDELKSEIGYYKKRLEEISI